MTVDLNRRPPVVTEQDRSWAMALCPSWCIIRDDRSQDDEIFDDGKSLDLEPDAAADWAAARPLRKARAKGRVSVDGAIAFAPADIEMGERYGAPNWAAYVDERIDAFEWAFAFDRDSAGSWSKRWRGFFKVADAEGRFPNSKPLTVPKGGYVFLGPGTALHVAALAYAPSPQARQVWAMHGVQFAGDDPMLAAIRRAALLRPFDPAGSQASAAPHAQSRLSRRSPAAGLSPDGAVASVSTPAREALP